MTKKSSERGVAIVLVVFIVALATILVVNLTHSTFLAARSNSMVEQRLKAEYILKSAVNVARALIKADDTTEDYNQDGWAIFSGGQQIPLEFLGINEPGLEVQLEIRAEEAKINILALVPSSARSSADPKWRGTLVRLFRELGFDDDGETDHTGNFNNRVFTSEELVAGLIDYMDSDQDSYEDKDGPFASGYESQLPEGYFSNKPVARISEISRIPGFTPARVRAITPFITVQGNRRININLAPRLVIKSLSENLTDDMVSQIISFRDGEEGPFTRDGGKFRQPLEDILGAEVFSEIHPNIDYRGRYFQVLAKVDYGSNAAFMRAVLREGGFNQAPAIRSFELF